MFGKKLREKIFELAMFKQGTVKTWSIFYVDSMETAKCFQKKQEEGDERKLKEGNSLREKVHNLMNTAVQCKDINLVKTNYPVMIVTEQKRRTIGRLNRIYKQPQHFQTALPPPYSVLRRHHRHHHRQRWKQ